MNSLDRGAGAGSPWFEPKNHRAPLGSTTRLPPWIANVGLFRPSLGGACTDRQRDGGTAGFGAGGAGDAGLAAGGWLHAAPAMHTAPTANSESGEVKNRESTPRE